ncbi:hypothetical protein SAMN02910289_00544 [Lachnospiraceae bacterium RM5]|nr:hypothetical protein SAMN02910289_00544 [Lachnospiraceae bacterium RM5]
MSMRNKKTYSIFIAYILIFLLFFQPVTVFGMTIQDIDINKTGNINIHFNEISEIVTISDGSLEIFKVADIAYNDGKIEYELTSGFLESDADLSDLENLEDSFMADYLADYAEEKGLTGTIKNIDENGNVSFEDLELGLYLITQKDDITGSYIVCPFLVSVPIEIDGKVLYSVDATPKVLIGQVAEQESTEETTIVEETSKETETTSMEETTKEEITTGKTTETEVKIPQTGMLIWPVILLFLTGILSVFLGIYLKVLSKQKRYEK